jgi:hypothetical protein
MEGKKVLELFAVLRNDGSVLMTRGGSSTKPALMVYESSEKAYNALNRQKKAAGESFRVERVYAADRRISK